MRLPNIQSWFENLSHARIFLVLAFLGLLAYANAINHPFVHDDIVYIKNNPHIAEFNIQSVFVQPSVGDAEYAKLNQYYRPFLELLNKIIFRIFGLNPHGYHFINVIIHITNAILVYLVFYRVTSLRKLTAFIAALLFLLHPIQSEAVACISGISNLAFTALSLTSFYLYLLFRKGNVLKHKLVLYAGSLLMFVVALLAKEQSVVLPVLIILYEICDGEFNKGMLRRLWPVAGFFILLGGYLFLRHALYGGTMLREIIASNDYHLILLAIPRSILIYLGLILFPHNLHYYRSQDILLPYLWPIMMLVVVVTVLCLIAKRTPAPYRQWMFFGLGWFFVSLLPASNVIPLVNEYSLILTAEHFLYLPIIGIILYVMGLLCHLSGRLPEARRFIAGLVAMVLVCSVYLSMTIKQNTFWKDEITLFKRTLQFEKNFGRVHFLLGQAYAQVGEIDKAIEEDFKALAIMHQYKQRVGEDATKTFYEIFIRQINHHLGLCYGIKGELEKSLKHYKAAWQYAPENLLYNFSLASTYLQMNDIPNAIVYFERMTDVNDDNLQIINNLAVCYELIGNLKKAEHYLRMIVAKDPTSTSARKNLENFLKRKTEIGMENRK